MTTGLPRITECRDCADPIRFVTMTATGRRVPVNPAPAPDGRGTIAAALVQTVKGRDLRGYAISADRPAHPTYPLRFTVHAATCKSRPRATDPKPDPAPADVDAPLF